jgi:hypothetical protein
VIALLLAVACGTNPPPDPGAEQASSPARPLAAFATQPLALLPAQHVRVDDPAGLASRVGPARELLRAVDDAIAAELAARGTGRSWVLPAVLARAAQRNPTIVSDPYALSAESLRSGVRRTNPRLGEPLASQMRSVIALTEARHALIPAEVRFEQSASGAHSAILRLVLVDGRLAQIMWAGDVTADVATPDQGAIATALARRVADLVIAP